MGDLSHGCYRENWLGLYDYAGRAKPDVIFINYCMAYWSGGRWPNTGDFKGPTSSNRRLRTYVHEMGHALGLDHNPLDQCFSVLRDIPSDAVATCYSPVNSGPVPHDGDDIRAYW